MNRRVRTRTHGGVGGRRSWDLPLSWFPTGRLKRGIKPRDHCENEI